MMSKAISSSDSSSDDEYIDMDDHDAINDDDLDPSFLLLSESESIDSRRRLEARLAERQLQKDIREFNFDY